MGLTDGENWIGTPININGGHGLSQQITIVVLVFTG